MPRVIATRVVSWLWIWTAVCASEDAERPAPCASQYQIATKVDNVYEVDLPGQVKDILNGFKTGVSFGFNGVSAVLECFDLRGYRATLAMYIMAPLVIATLILAATACHVGFRSVHKAGTRRMTMILERAAPFLLELMFIMYPLVATKAFEAFPCYEFTSSSYLRADVAIEGFSPEHDQAKALAIVAIIMYPVG